MFSEGAGGRYWPITSLAAVLQFVGSWCMADVPHLRLTPVAIRHSGSRVSRGYAAAMCGRFTQHYTWREIHELLFGLVGAARNVGPRYNMRRVPNLSARTIFENIAFCLANIGLV
jgi:hypothetical protein